MKRHFALTTAILAFALAASGAAMAQTKTKTTPATGTQSGADTSNPTAGTGNAGDKTTEPGTGTPAPRKMHHKRAKKMAPAASTAE